MSDPLQQMALFLNGRDGPFERPPQPPVVEEAEVTAVTPGAGQGGTTLVTVLWRGGTCKASTVDTYTSPAVGDSVLVVHANDRLYIHGRITGRP